MRTERAPADATFTNADLIENFRQVIFYDEYVYKNGEYLEERAPRTLEKFTGAVSYSVHGSGVSDVDLSQISGIAERISSATGLSIKKTGSFRSMIRVGILTRAERIALSASLSDGGGNDAVKKDLATDMGGVLCAAYPFDSEVAGDDSTIYLIVIPDEVSGLLRQACIEEEFGQAFGPSADYEKARPSIFNDDFEFALFTIHDEWLFRILYDPRLRPGMKEKEAMPIVRQIVAELRPEDRTASIENYENHQDSELKNSSSQK